MTTAASQFGHGFVDAGTDPSLNEKLANWHFREEAASPTVKSELTFDYKFREGVATGTNALRILQSRGLTILNDI